MMFTFVLLFVFSVFQRRCQILLTFFQSGLIVIMVIFSEFNGVDDDIVSFDISEIGREILRYY